MTHFMITIFLANEENFIHVNARNEENFIHVILQLSCKIKYREDQEERRENQTTWSL